MSTNVKVSLIGAGPGDPDLITIKGKEAIEKADVIIYDYLASPNLLNHTRKNAEIIYVGKRGGDHTLSQEEINNLLVEKAQEGFTVARLKGGDPFVFGRGGEEAEVLIGANIPFEIIPGVTSAIAVPAYAGIPLTHRQFTSTLAFVTGHEDPEKNKSKIDWESLAKGIGTIVFLMGVKNLEKIVAKLLKHGKSSDTPVALIRWGTTPKQYAVAGTLADIVEKVRAINLKPPAVIVVGDVVKLREKMAWFENRPLMGKTILVTRARKQASDLVKLLSDLGADCIEFPVIRVDPPDDLKPLDLAIKNLPDYEWLIFTSVNGIEFFFERLFNKAGKDVRALNHIRTAVIGTATEKKLLEFGLKSDIIPQSFKAESVVEAFAKKNIKGKKVLLPRAQKGRSVLPVELTRMGAVVDDVAVYSTKPEGTNSEHVMDLLSLGEIDLITFTSSSTVHNFFNMLPPEKCKMFMEKMETACIGPITAETARKTGFNVNLMADSYTITGLCDAILKYYA
ncbi:MAG TPA: uroporphyrinogen-III C-methyltransferase [Desulfobacteraceae bacterium]|nr:uroporphyrinogen-III C-methyltransferase [Desulfobacteraceae bacterium]